MPLQETSGNVTTDAYGGGVAAVPNYIEDVFSTYLYTGNSSTQTITNGIDLSGKGGLVWNKLRAGAGLSANHKLYDTARGVNKELYTNLTSAQGTKTDALNAFNANGFTLGAQDINETGGTYASWTFRKQSKFFDVVTYTGNGVDGRAISHNLGSSIGCIIIKKTSGTGAWPVWQRTLTDASGSYANNLFLNTTDAASNQFCFGPASSQTSTYFTVSNDSVVNGSGSTYVAYLFAHNAGGFGLTGTDNVISCGSYVGNSTTPPTIELGFEPQFLLIKNAETAGTAWYLADTMRGFSQTGWSRLFPNTSGAESSSTTYYVKPTATGFQCVLDDAPYNDNGKTHIYIAIRRGPMKVPTTGTSVYNAVAYTGDGSTTRQISTTITPDLSMTEGRSSAYVPFWNTRLTGANLIYSSSTGAERLPSGFTDGGFGIDTNSQAGIAMAAGSGGTANNSNANTVTYINWNFKRAPSVFDVVCYTGTGTQQNITHNLGVAPELLIVKRRTSTGTDWAVYNATITASYELQLNSTDAKQTGSQMYWANTAPTSTVFTVRGAGGGINDVNRSGDAYVAYLFATCAGVSKVGSYTGNGSTQTINCGFTGGARFVLIKRTDSTGDWYVYDTARGMTTLTDPYLLLNSTAAESATLGSVTTVSTGFAVNASILAAINTNGATYIFLAIA